MQLDIVDNYTAMPFLIDGHNLISYLSDLELTDPHDEAKLVLRLRGFCARTRKKVVVVFDEGLPGGTSHLTTPSVTVIFASSRQSNADGIIRERIHNTHDFKGWTVVSSDNEVLAEARNAGMQGMRCVDFARIMVRQNKRKAQRDVDTNVFVPPTEVEAWLQIFGEEAPTSLPATDPAPKRPKKPRQPQNHAQPNPNPTRESPKPKRKKRPSGSKLPQDEVDAWLKIFGEDGGHRQATDAPQRIVPRHKRNRRQQESAEEAAMRNDVASWMELFGESDEERQPTDPRPQRSDPSKQGRFGGDKRGPVVHKNMSTSDEIFLSEGEVEQWMDFFGVEDEEDEDA